MTAPASPAGAAPPAGYRIRRFERNDAGAYCALIEALSPADVRLRFHSASRPSRAQVDEMIFGPAALGAVLAESADGVLRGVAHAALEGSARRGEFGILVAAAHRRLGLGGALTDALLARLAARGTTQAVAYTAWENGAAAALLRSRGFAGKHDGGGTVRWVRPLAAHAYAADSSGVGSRGPAPAEPAA